MRLFRFNSLLRGQEDEEAFWEGMKNTNVKKERRGFEAESESEDGDSGTPEPTKPDAAVRPAGPNRNAANSAGSAKTGGSAPGAPVPVAGDKKKHNSRKFDRHHQKDRSTRKFGV